MEVIFEMKKIALVLGGGAAKGYAHIGVIKALEEWGLYPDVLIGTSMGALIAGFYSAGFTPAEMEKIAKEMDVRKMAKVFGISLSSQGFVSLEGVEEYLRSYLGYVKIQALKRKFVATAVDITNNQALFFDRGDLVKAILMSISIPFVFVPISADRIIVDGGVLDNVPVRALSLLDENYFSIAVNVVPTVKHTVRLADSDEIPVKEKLNLIEKITKKRPEAAFREQAMGFISYIVRVSQMMISEINMRRIEEYRSDIYFDVDSGIDSQDFHKAEIAIEAGYKRAQEMKGQILTKLGTEG